MTRPLTSITISVNPETGPGFTVTQGCTSCDGLGWDEMIGQIVNLTHPKIRAPHYPMLTPAERTVYEARRELKAAERLLEAERANMELGIPF